MLHQSQISAFLKKKKNFQPDKQKLLIIRSIICLLRHTYQGFKSQVSLRYNIILIFLDNNMTFVDRSMMCNDTILIWFDLIWFDLIRYRGLRSCENFKIKQYLYNGGNMNLCLQFPSMLLDCWSLKQSIDPESCIITLLIHGLHVNVYNELAFTSKLPENDFWYSQTFNIRYFKSFIQLLLVWVTFTLNYWNVYICF